MTRRKTQEEIVAEFRETHGVKYDYSKFIYGGIDTKGIIICPEHGEFLQSAWVHKKGSACRQCAMAEEWERKRWTFEYFVNKANKIHNNIYAYNKDTWNCRGEKTDITCPTHGLFKQRPADHANGQGCPLCGVLRRLANTENVGASKESQKVLEPILELLDVMDVKYYFDKREFMIPGSRKRYDLVIEDLGICIEYNGYAFHPDYYSLDESQWKKWKSPFKDASADDKMKYDQDKARRLYEHNGCRTWMITPTNAELYVDLLEQEIIKKAP